MKDILCAHKWTPVTTFDEKVGESQHSVCSRCDTWILEGALIPRTVIAYLDDTLPLV